MRSWPVPWHRLTRRCRRWVRRGSCRIFFRRRWRVGDCGINQDWVLRCWRERGRLEPRPAFRVVFLTRGMQRANHMLWLARQCARNPDRHLV